MFSPAAARIAMISVSGGKFWSGFASGAISSIAASAWSGGGSTSNYHGAGNFAKSGVGMISFGTVSGGVGAQLTGGNFWQGAVTGLVVSGLNHYAHKIQERLTLLQYLKETQIDPKSIPEKSINSINYLKNNIKQLLKLYTASQVNSFTVDPQEYGARGQLATTYSDNSITFYGSSFKDNFTLAYTMFHEGAHAYFNLIGLSAQWKNDYGSDVAKVINEYNAHRMMYELDQDHFSLYFFDYNDSMNANSYGNGNMNHWQSVMNIFK